MVVVCPGIIYIFSIIENGILQYKILNIKTERSNKKEQMFINCCTNSEQYVIIKAALRCFMLYLQANFPYGLRR